MVEIVCILGATATGKSDVAVSVAREFGGEVISADSMQVYRGLDIGTAKLPEAERHGVAHHLIDICNPDESFSAGEFQALADRAIKEIFARGRMPIVVGGTGLYFKALLRGLAPVGSADKAIRTRLRERSKRAGLASIYALLQRLDPETANQLPPGDEQRILRALEYRIRTGGKISETIAKHPFGVERYYALKIGIRAERSVLYGRIERRVDRMLEQGLVDEVRALLDSGVAPDSQAMRAIGYREVVRYIRKEVTLGQATEDIKKSTRHYAKRQETWFRRERNATWISEDSLKKTINRVKQLITGKKNARRKSTQDDERTNL